MITIKTAVEFLLVTIFIFIKAMSSGEYKVGSNQDGTASA
jgi:hypothetical protein